MSIPFNNFLSPKILESRYEMEKETKRYLATLREFSKDSKIVIGGIIESRWDKFKRKAKEFFCMLTYVPSGFGAGPP